MCSNSQFLDIISRITLDTQRHPSVLRLLVPVNKNINYIFIMNYVFCINTFIYLMQRTCANMLIKFYLPPQRTFAFLVPLARMRKSLSKLFLPAVPRRNRFHSKCILYLPPVRHNTSEQHIIHMITTYF